MSINKLKSIVRRGTLFGAAFAVVAATFAPASMTFADALNPLTDRSLTLSSSSPGWDYKDGSGNATYAPPNSGANGQKTGNTFAFKVSSTETIEAFTFQYCTTSAGDCLSPGDNGYDGTPLRNPDSATTSDLNVVVASPAELDATDFGTVIDSSTGEPKRSPVDMPDADNSQGNFTVMVDVAGTWTRSAGWTMTAKNKETGTVGAETATGANNFITLANSTGEALTAGQAVRIVFFATNTNYITNPGSGAFFVKINDYKAVDVTTPATPVILDADLVDGGVTVANVMNQSIQIQTKVLETMDFSVGTVDPNTLSSGSGGQLEAATGALAQQAHSVCDRILTGMTPADSVNTLKMGNQIGEFSLETGHTYSTHSYWRLSSNSSAGATVYYSGNTLSNTVNDKIAAIGATKAAPTPGGEQFGLALANATSGPYAVNYSTEEKASNLYEYGADDTATGLVALRADELANPGAATLTGIDATMFTDPAGSNPSYHAPQLYPLVPEANYNQGAGNVNSEYGTVNTAFAFDETSQQIPVPIATEDNLVVDCVTAKMRYIANIAATTPAGIYTTKINYIAAPQY